MPWLLWSSTATKGRTSPKPRSSHSESNTIESCTARGQKASQARLHNAGLCLATPDAWMHAIGTRGSGTVLRPHAVSHQAGRASTTQCMQLIQRCMLETVSRQLLRLPRRHAAHCSALMGRLRVRRRGGRVGQTKAAGAPVHAWALAQWRCPAALPRAYL